jgi:hypothetical protein
MYEVTFAFMPFSYTNINPYNTIAICHIIFIDATFSIHKFAACVLPHYHVKWKVSVYTILNVGRE